MLEDSSQTHASDAGAILRAALEHLVRPEVALITFAICLAIALFALMKVWSDLRRNGRKAISTTPGSTRPADMADPPVAAAGPREEDAPDRATENRDLGYSALRARKCVWKKDAIQPHADTTRWLCSTCNGYSFTSDGGPPATCRAYEPKQKI